MDENGQKGLKKSWNILNLVMKRFFKSARLPNGLFQVGPKLYREAKNPCLVFTAKVNQKGFLACSLF